MNVLMLLKPKNTVKYIYDTNTLRQGLEKTLVNLIITDLENKGDETDAVEAQYLADLKGGADYVDEQNLAALCDRMADLLELHTDYSLWESYLRLDAVEKVRNPDFPKTLFDNASCSYCRSHQYELARHWYAPHVRKMAERLAKAVAAGDRKATFSEGAEQERLALKAKPLESLKPTIARTAENFRKVIREIEVLCK